MDRGEYFPFPFRKDYFECQAGCQGRNRLAYDDIIDSLDIGSVIYPKYITADYILQYVRATQNSIGSNVETLYHILGWKGRSPGI